MNSEVECIVRERLREKPRKCKKKNRERQKAIKDIEKVNREEPESE